MNDNSKEFVTANQVLCHFTGDYLLQSHYMALHKGKRSKVAAAHAATYTLPFLFLTRSWKALAVIGTSHFILDRFKLSRYAVWSKNQLAPLEDRSMTPTGMPKVTPDYLAVWLNIITDNIIHVICNAIALRKE